GRAPRAARGGRVSLVSRRQVPGAAPAHSLCPDGSHEPAVPGRDQAARRADLVVRGGMDLTPYYGFEEDARHFHATCRQALEAFGPECYPRFKRWCDEYFYLKHRSEPRGIGGIFFDDLNESGFDSCFELARGVGDHFLPAYLSSVG